MLTIFSINILSDSVVFAQTIPRTTITHPKLVVLLVADQLPYNYFSICANNKSGGFRRLLDNGANFTNCHYLGSTNQTAPNLAVIATGAYPWSNGIIGNQWYDRRKQKFVTATIAEEPSSASSDNTNGTNTHTLLGTTIGDELKIATGGFSRIIAISTSSQDSLLLAGRLADQYFWWDYRSGNFISPVHLGKDFPGWASKFNEQNYSNQYFGKSWQPNGQSSPGSYNIKENNDSPNKIFAHALNDNSSLTMGEGFNNQFIATPWANQMLLDFAQEAIEQNSLGHHDSPDMLSVSFSSFEAVGKKYGTYSPESQDLILRFDQSLAEFLLFLNRKVGLTNCLIVFTAAHGAGPSPEFLRAQGMEAGTIETKAFRDQLNTALSARLGSASWVEAFEPPNLYLNLNAIDSHNYHQPDIEKLAAKLAHSISGTGDIYGAYQLFMNQLPSSSQTEAIRKSYFWGRSGELYIIPKPGFSFIPENDNTASGSPYNYDTQIPLIIYGNSVKTGTYASSVSPDDIAPTLANILGICSPSLATGHVLDEMLNLRY